MPRKLPPNVVQIRNSTGRQYFYFQKGRGGPHASARVPMPGDLSSPEFWVRYADLMRLPPPLTRTDTVEALVRSWRQSPEWLAMANRTQIEWTRHSDRIVKAWGPLEVKGIEPRHVLELRDAWSHKPATANLMLDVLTAMMRWSVPRGWRDDNPCREVHRLPKGDGYEPWPQEAIEQARDTLRPNMWLAVALALYTGQRLGDLLKMRWASIAEGRIRVKQSKTGAELVIPIHRDLQSIFDETKKTAVTILTTNNGTPWQSGFQATWQKHRPPLVKEQGLVFHGLRKSAVVTLLEARCTTAEVAAITGQTLRMVEHYAKGVNQERLAQSAIARWEAQL